MVQSLSCSARSAPPPACSQLINRTCRFGLFIFCYCYWFFLPPLLLMYPLLSNSRRRRQSATGRSRLTLFPIRGELRNFLPVRRLSAFHTFSKILADSSLSFIRIAFADAILVLMLVLLMLMLVLAVVRGWTWSYLRSFTASM